MFLPGFGPRPFKKTRVTDLERFADRSLISMREKNLIPRVERLQDTF